MFYQTRYGVGTKVNVMYDPNDKNQPAVINNTLGIIYQVKSLDPTMSYYLPIGKKPLPFAATENQ